MITLEVLISCMHQKDHSIIERTNIQSDVIVVNQCDTDKYEEWTFTNKNGEECRAIFISTTERGLSKSRNMAIRYAIGDICLICDDDEILYNNYTELIIRTFEESLDTDVLAFQINDAGKTYPKSKKRIGYLGALKLASWQLAFKRDSVCKNNIQFDTSLGSGVSKAGGEENKFVYDCLRNKLKVMFIPVTIGRMIEGESQWFHGFTDEFFYDRGIMTTKLMGKSMATLYAVYYLIRKWPLYRKDVNLKTATISLFNGIYKK